MIKKIGFTALIIGFIGVVAIVSFLVIKRPWLPKETVKHPAVRIGLSIDTLSTERWQLDRDLIKARIEELGGSVVSLVAGSDDKVQIEQIENFITQKVDAIIVIPHDSKALSKVIEKARNQGIKVIAYDRLIEDTGLDLYISFDSVKVGYLQAEGVISRMTGKNVVYVGGSPTDHNSILLKEGAMKVLQPKIDSGDINLISDTFSENWNADVAYSTVKKLLVAGKKIDGIIAGNDDLAYGSITALSEFGLAGKIPVSGQDANLTACQRIIKGTQSITVYKPIKDIASKAAELTIDLIRENPFTPTSFTENGSMSVPSVFLDSISVDRSNMDETIIKDGLHSRADVYK